MWTPPSPPPPAAPSADLGGRSRVCAWREFREREREREGGGCMEGGREGGRGDGEGERERERERERGRGRGPLQAQRAGRRGATWATCTPIALAHQDGSQQSATAFGFSWQQCHCSASQSPQDRVMLLCLERQPPSKAHDHVQDGVEGAPGTALAP